MVTLHIPPVWFADESVAEKMPCVLCVCMSVRACVRVCVRERDMPVCRRYMPVYTCVHGCICHCTDMWRTEVDASVFESSLSLSALLIEMGFLMEPETHHFC